MRYVFVSKFGDSFFLAYRMMKLGEDVYFYVDEHHARNIGKGMGLTLVTDFYEVLNKYPKDEFILIFDQTGLGEEADFLRKAGYAVFGASAIADKLEEERSFATSVMGKYLPTPPTTKFTDFQTAKKFIQNSPDDERYVFKPEGEDTPSSWTYVARDKADMLDRLDYYKHNWSVGSVEFDLQLFMKGIEFDFSGFFRNDGKWIEDGFECYFEDKKFMDGNVGQTVGCADALQYFTTSKEPYFKDYLSKFTPFLKENGFSGQFTVNNIISEKDHKPYALEISPRCGYDSFQNEMYGLLATGKNPKYLFESVALGKPVPSNYFPLKKMLFSVRISVPPYPVSKDVGDAKGHVINFDKKLENHFMYGDVCYNEETEKYECTGADGVIGTVCAMGDTIPQVRDIVYKNLIPMLNVAQAQYRTDGAIRCESDIKTLRQWGTIL